MVSENRGAPPETTVRRWVVTVRGIVQGVGFRPFVFQLAHKYHLSGWVRNEADQVRIEVQGSVDLFEGFCRDLKTSHPLQARIQGVEISEVPAQLSDEKGFQIVASGDSAPPAPTVPADLASCRECIEEVLSPGERRYRYPFTNCTNCGPRWSIIRGLPYDRPQTSMATFPMCEACAAEYYNPHDRRFHAQPIACPRCGPSLTLVDGAGSPVASGDDALSQAAKIVAGGGTLALLGLGGFQLVVDACQPAAVARLRLRKRRPDKPFAIMVGDPGEVSKWCVLGDPEEKYLTSPQAPILLLRKRVPLPAGTPPTAEEVAPGNPYLGVMLPYTPLHRLLIDQLARPVVCTSGNVSEEPMAISPQEGLRRLRELADAFLIHNRPIVRPVDDSVARIIKGDLQLFRRARGYAPIPLHLAKKGPTVLALGGHLKNTVGLLLGEDAILSAHIGDLDNALSLEVHRRAVEDLLSFFRAAPEVIACDLHPDYASTLEAESLSRRLDIPLIRVQHHHAHIVAAMMEHHWEGPVLGVAWDGSGYGPDGTVWGGEFLVVDWTGYRRVATFRTFPLPGGERAVREPRRSALGILAELWETDRADEAYRWLGEFFKPAEWETLWRMLARGVRCPRTSSVGRLFDAVAALCGLMGQVSFEGQAAMALEFQVQPNQCSITNQCSIKDDRNEWPTYPISLREGSPVMVDWAPMIEAILQDLRTGVKISEIAERFHRALVETIVMVAQWVGLERVVLSGGCFQNGVLTELALGLLGKAGFQAVIPRLFPPGDGGIALGQLGVASALCQANLTSP